MPAPFRNDFQGHPELFWARVEKLSSGCWVWKGKLNGGYGHVRVGGHLTGAHRMAFFLTHGRWPNPHALHRCDNGPCCNPEHLFEGTQKDNNEDRDRKGRHVALRGEKHGGHKLTATQVEEIRTAYQPSTGPNPSDTSTTALARKYGVSQGMIWRIVRDLNWKGLREVAA